MNEEELIVNWWDLPDSLQLKLKNPLPELSKDRTLVTVRKCKRYADYGEITNLVMGIKHHIRSSKHLKLKFPLVFNSELYAKLYALMLSEGSFNTEFSLNLPEDFFHKMFFECIKGLLSVDVANKIMYDYNSGFKRSRAPAQVRYMIPLPVSVPALIKNNKSLAKSYLRVAFEAEGSPILDIASHKRYIKLTRYTSVDDCVKVDLLPLAKRVFKGKLKQFNPEVCVAIESKPPVLLLDEQKMLQKHFNIESKLYFEAVRNNHTGFRAGKITARWVLIIYATNINRFISEVGFLSKRKNTILNAMKKIKARNPQYFCLRIMKIIADKEGVFTRKQFKTRLNSLGYQSPSVYLWRYCKKGLINRVGKGRYELV